VALVRLLDSRHRGVVHFGNTGRCSRYEVAAAIASTVNADESRLERVSAEEIGGIARRPAREEIDTAPYTQLTGDVPRDWKSALQSYLRGGDPEPGRE